jgi:hypothetical protein
VTATSSAHFDSAAGQLAALASWASSQAEEASGFVAASEACFDVIETAWGGPRASAAVASGRTYVSGQRSTTDALSDAAGVFSSFAATASAFATRARQCERLLATDPAAEGAEDVIRSARHRLAALGAEWQAVCRGLAARIDGCVATVETARQATPDLAGTGSGTSGPYGFSGSAFGGRGAALNPLLGPMASLLASRLGWILGNAGSTLAAIQRLVAFASGRAGDQLAEEITDLPADEVAAYWEALSEDAQNALIEARPDVAALVVIANGATLTEDQLDLLDSANAYGTFTREFEGQVETEAGLRVVTVTFDAEFSAVMTKMSDGSVEMVLLGGAAVGLGLDANIGGVGADARAGAYGQAFQLLRFENEEDAEEAVERLQEAAEAGLDVFELGPSGQQTPGTVSSTGGLSTVSDFLSKPGDALGGLFDLFSDDGLKGEIENLFEEHGVLLGSEGGAFAVAEGELDLGEIAEAEIEAEVHVGRFSQEPANGSDEPARSGVILSGEVLARAETSAGPGAEVQGAFAVEAYDHGGEQYVTITVQASAEGGMAGEIFDAAGVEIDAQGLGGGRATMELTVPVSSDLLPSLESVVTGLPTGSIGGNALAEVIDASEMSLTLESTRTVYTETEFDAGVVAVEVETTTSDSVTQVALHKFPGGPIYSQETVDGVVAAELDE